MDYRVVSNGNGTLNGSNGFHSPRGTVIHVESPDKQGLADYEYNLDKNRDERDAIQKKTFTKWVNKHLRKHWRYVQSGRKVDDLFTDLRDGLNLIALLEVLTSETLPRERGRLKVHVIQNVETCLELLRRKKVKLVNIRAEDIVDGNPKLTLGLIWTIILHFQVSEPWGEDTGGLSAKDALLQWAQRVTQGYSGVNVKNFTTSWRDGLAFNAILHRYRPDLVNWKEVKNRLDARQRLEKAFNLAEREFGVTRLLDPEDVDVQNPDEKSMMVYISSLYDALPEQPGSVKFEHDMSEYRTSAREFLQWVHRATRTMQDRSTPFNVVELRQLLSELERLKSAEIPQRLRDKQRLEQIYSELEMMFGETGQLRIEEELSSASLDRAWNALLQSLNERERYLRERTGAQSSLQDTTHRLHQGIGVVNEKLDSILYRIENAESRIKVTPPHEMIEIVDAIVYDLDALEQPIDGFFADVNTLKAERHPQANEYYQQVFGLHQRRIAYLDRCQAELNARIQKRKGEEMEHKRIESERYMSIKEKVFTRVEECILWVEKRLVDLSEMQFVEEIIELEQMFEQHKIDHHEINDFRHQVDQCIARQAEVSAEDSGSYCDLLTKLEQEYAQLRELSSGRMLDLDSLIAFIRAAHLELVWITEREELETSRNWSDISQLDLPMLQNYYKQLLHEIELREEQFNSVHNQGAALLNQGHPAVGVIETYLTTMQAQWDWLLALTQCLEIHLQDSTNLKQFMEDAKNCEQWMERQMQLLNAHYERADYSVDEGEKLLKELDEIRDMLDRYHEVLLSLIERSRIISPLWQRGERILRPIPVHALCRYEERNIVIRKGDECILLDNSDMLRWLVRTPEGVEGMVPSVVFRVPPPDERILGYIQRLQAQFERLRRLWLEKNRLIRFNMIMKMARDIRSWDLKHFLALDPAQREAIINALNDDANKFLSELDPNDPLAIRLREEIRLANDHLYKLLQMSQRGAEPDVAAKFDEKLTVILPNLEEYWRILNQRVAAPIPRDIDAWEKMIMEHKSFEDSLQSLESEIVMLQELFRQIPDPTPMQRSKMEQLLNHWENLWDLSKWYAERLKASEPVLNGIAEASHIINEHEFRLGSYDQLPANLDKLRALHSELLEIQLVLQQQQPVLDDLASNVVHLRQHVARTRFNVADHPDVDRMEDEVQQLTVRWENVCMSVIDRLKSVEIAIQILMVYRAAYENEVAWLDRVEATINNLRDPSHLRPEEYQDQLEMLISEYSSLQERTAAMENVNHEGGKYIREARVYDARIQRYFDVLEEIHRGRESMFRRTIPAPIPGADQVQKELDDLNRRFSQLASIILERRNVVQVMIQNYRRQQQEEDGRKRMEDEAARRAAEEAERLRRLREEEEARRKAAQEEADRLRRLREAEEEEARRRAKEAEDKRRREEEERERERERKRREEEERRRREEEERERERQRRKAAEEEAERLRKQREAEERERRRKEDEARRKAGEDEAARQRRLREEEEARRKREEEERERERERKRREEEERRRREEEERRRREEEERRKRQQEEEDRLRREREEIIKSRIHIPNVGGGDGRIHVKLPEVKLPETKHGHLIGEGGMEGEISEWDSTKEIPGVVTVSEHEDDMIMYAEETEVRTKFYELDAIKHMQTGEILTFVEAIRQGLLDLHSGEFFDIVSGARISLEEAVERNYVSQSFTDCLNTHYGIRDPSNGEAINLLEAIQRGIYDPECRQLRDPTTGDLLSLYDASRLGVVSMDNVHKLIKMGILKLPPLSLEHAIDQKVIDLETGTFIGRFSRETLPLRDALRNGYITVSSSLTPQIAISLTECIENRFINPNNGEFNDKNTNEKFTLRDAVGKANALINLNVREIVNTSERKRITVGEALLRNALNTRQGNFTDLAQRQSMSLLEAHEQEFIQKPLTLKDVYSKDLVDSVGRFIDGGTKKRMTLLEAIAEGLIDPDVPHIVDPESKEIMSIAEALENGVLTANGRFVPPGTPDHLTLHEAARHGWLTDPVKSSIFDVKAIKNTKTNQTLSFNEAVEAGIVQLQSERFVDLATNDSYLLPDTVEKGRLIDGQLHMILSQLSGLKDNQGNQMTVFKAIASGAINTKKGSYVDKRSNQEMSPKEAYERGFISLRGAMQLTALFNVHPSLIAVARPKKVMKKEIKRGGRSTADDQKIKMTLADAMKQGLVDAKSHKFSHGGVEMTLEDALSKGLVDTNAEWIVPAKGTGVGPTIQESVTEQVTETSQVLAPRKAVDKQSQETVTTVKRKKIKETTATGGPGGVALYRAITSGRGSLEVPVDGFHILEAERNGLIDLNSGLVSLPDSDRTLTFEEAVELGIINPKVFSVRNPKTGKSLSLVEALEQNVIDATGHMFDQKTGRKLSFQAAIDADYILVNPEQSAMDTKPAMKVIQFGVSAGAGPIMSFTPVGTSVVEETETAWSFDSTTGEVFDRFTGERLRLDEAVRSQKVTTDNLRVKDALTDRELSYADAVKWGIIDPTNFRYSDKREQRDHSFQEAAIRGLIFLGGGRPELAKEALQTHVHQQTRKVVATKEAAIAGPAAFVDYSLQKVIDLGWYNKATGTFTHPDTKKQMTLKEAIMKGLFNPYESIVVDQSTGEALSLLDAVQSGVIDANSGTIVDKETGKNVDLVRAFEMGLIRSGIVPQTLESVINSGKLNLSTGEVVSPDGGAGIALHDAISKGLIDASSIIVKDPQSGREISFIEAVHTKIIDLSRGLMINKSTGDAVSLLQGVISGTIQPVGAPDSIKRAKSSQAASLQLYPVTGPKTSPKVHPGGGGGGYHREEMMDIGGKQVMVKVIKDEDGVGEKGEYVDSSTGMKFLVQLHGDPYVTRTKTTVKSRAQVQQVELEPTAELIGIDQVRDNRTGRVMTLAEAQRAGLARVDKKGKQLMKSYAVFRSDIVHALNEGVVDASNGVHISLADAIRSKLVDIKELMYCNPVTGENVDFVQAANQGLMDVSLAEVLPKGVCNPASGDRIAVSRAIELKIINPKTGEVMNPFTNKQITWLDIVKPVYASLTMEGVYDPRKGYAVPVTSALIEGLVNPRTEVYHNPITNDGVSLSEAVKVGLIDEGTYRAITQPSITDWRTGNKVSLLKAVDLGLVDPQHRTVQLAKGHTVPIVKAVEEGKIPHDVGSRMRRVEKLTFADALGKGLIDVKSNQFTDTDSGKKLTIAQALEQGFIDTGSVESMEGIDERNLVHVIDSEEFDVNSGRIRDQKSGLYLTFRQAIDKGLIDGDSLLYEVDSGKTMTVRECADRGRIDNNGKYVDQKSGAKVNLKDAVRVGLIALIASPMMAGQAVAEAIKRRETEGFKFKIEKAESPSASPGGGGTRYVQEHVTTYKVTPRKVEPTLSLKVKTDEAGERLRSLLSDPQAVADRHFEFIENLKNKDFDIEDKIIENPATGNRVSAKDAVETGLLDVLTGEIVHPLSGRRYSIPRAVHMKMIQPNAAKNIMESLNMSLEELHQIIQTLSPRSDHSPIASMSPSTYSASPGGGTTSYVREDNAERNCAQCESRIDDILLKVKSYEQTTLVKLQRSDDESNESLEDKIRHLSEYKLLLEKQQGDVADCLASADRVSTDGAQMLSPEEFHNLLRHKSELQDVYGTQLSKVDAMLSRLTLASKLKAEFESRTSTFRTWCSTSDTALVRLMANVGDPTKLDVIRRRLNDIGDDVRAKDEDLNEITILSRRVADEYSNYSLELASSSGLSSSMYSSKSAPVDADVRGVIDELTDSYKNLTKKCDHLRSMTSAVNESSADYEKRRRDVADWLSKAERRVDEAVCDRPDSTDLRKLNVQLSNVRELTAEIVEKQTSLDQLRAKGNEYLNLIENGDEYDSQKTRIDSDCNDLERRHSQINMQISDQGNKLQSMLTQSQGVLEGLESTLRWLDESGDKTATNRPLPLNKDQLAELMKQQRVTQSDIDRHRPAIAALIAEAESLLAKDPSNHKLRHQLDELKRRYDDLSESNAKYGEQLTTTNETLEKFNSEMNRLGGWLEPTVDNLSSKELSQKELHTFAPEVSRYSEELTTNKGELETLRNLWQQLLASGNVVEAKALREKLAQMERKFDDAETLVVERKQQAEERRLQFGEYDVQKAKVHAFLKQSEDEVDRLAPVGLSFNVLSRQSEDLTPYIEKHDKFRPEVEIVERLGVEYHRMLYGDAATAAAADGKKPKREFLSPLLSPSSTTSSGFSSLDNMSSMADLSPVQQEVIEMRHRYDVVGQRLKDRRQELTANLDLLNKHKKQYEMLTQWVDGQKTKFANLPLPTNREDAVKNLNDVKDDAALIQRERTKLEDFKANCHELTRLKPEVSGVRELQNQANDLCFLWEDLSEDCRRALQRAEDAKDFYMSYGHLKSWMNSKQKMISALGIVGTEPHLINAQLQQIQVLKDEFDGERSNVDVLNHCGNTLVVASPTDSAESRNVAEKLNDINSKWDDLSMRLNEREQNLTRAGEMCGGFAEKQKSLKIWIAEALRRIEDLMEVPVTSENVDAKMSEIQKMQAELNAKSLELNSLKTSADRLSDIDSDPSVKVEINSKLQAIQQPFDELTRKLDNLQENVKNVMSEGLEFDEKVKSLVTYIGNSKERLNAFPGVSAKGDNLMKVAPEFDEFYRSILDKEIEVSLVRSKGPSMAKKSGDLNLTTKLDQIEMHWDPLLKATKEKKSRFDRALDVEKQFSMAADGFDQFLSESNEQLNALRNEKDVYDVEQFERRLRSIEDFRADVANHTQEYKSTQILGEQLIACTDSDQIAVQDRLDKMRDTWTSLNEHARKAAKSTDAKLKSLNEFNSALTEARGAVATLDDRVARSDAQDSRALEKLKLIRDDLNGVQTTKLKAVKDASAKMKDNSKNPDSDFTTVDTAVALIVSKVDGLNADLSSKVDQLESASDRVRAIRDDLTKLAKDAKTLDADFAALGPLARDADHLKSQKFETEDFVKTLSDKNAHVENASKKIDGLRDDGFEADAEHCVDSLARTKDQLTSLDQQAAKRVSDLDKMLEELTDLFDDADQAHNGILEILSSDVLQKPASNDLPSIRKQLETLKIFKDGLNPMQKRVEDILAKGRFLIKSAGPNVDTSLLESEMNKLSEGWNELKSRVNEREQKLDRSLLGLGNYQESLSNMLNWLDDSENLLANQKLPSADHKVVKEQLAAQKLLQKLIDDKQPNVEAFKNMVEQVAQNAEDSERQQLHGSLDEIVGRYDALCADATTRRQNLHDAQELAEQWAEHMQPLIRWFENTEKRLQQFDNVPTNEEKLAAQIDEHKKLHEDIENHRQSMDNVVEISEELRRLVSPDDADELTQKCDDVATRYDRLGTTSLALGKILGEMADGIGTFLVKTEDLKIWLDDMEVQLSKFDTISAFMDTLTAQREDIMTLAQEICTRQTDVTEIIKEGRELCKHTNSDDASALHAQLESMKSRYSILNKTADDKLDLLINAYPLAATFHDAHQKLSDFLNNIESAFSLLDQATIEEQQDVLPNMEEDINAFRPMVDQMKSDGARLCGLTSKEGSKTIEEMSARISRRFDAVSEQYQRRAERLSIARQHSLEVIGDMDNLIETLQMAESHMINAGAASSDPIIAKEQLKEQRMLNDEVNSHRARSRDLIAAAKRLQNNLSGDDKDKLRDQIEVLKELTDSVCQLSAERLSVLEEALPLAEHFQNSLVEFNDWLTGAERELESAPSVMPGLHRDQLKKQFDHNKTLQSSIQEIKPLADTLNKTGKNLEQLCNDDDKARVNDSLDQANHRFDNIRENVRDRGLKLDDALNQSSQFSDKLENMLNSLTAAADHVRNPDPIAAHPDAIRDQIHDNCALMEELDQKSSAFQSVKESAVDIIRKADPNDPAVEEIRAKIQMLDVLWDEIQTGTDTRGRNLVDTLKLAELFWGELQECVAALRDLAHVLERASAPACELDAIRLQQEEMRLVDKELHDQAPKMDSVKEHGEQLLRFIGEPEKPDVQQKIDELSSVWETVTAAFHRRNDNLIEAMEKAMNFHEMLNSVMNWLADAEQRYSSMQPISSNLIELQAQIEEVGVFKDDLDKHTVDLEQLNQQSSDLAEGSSPDQALAVKMPLEDITSRWDKMSKGLALRQQKLERALLKMGQFEQASNQLIDWMDRTDQTLNEIRPVPGDLKQIEIEFAKLKVIANDVHAHQPSVDTLTDAGRKLIEGGHVESPEATQKILDDLSNKWILLQQKLAAKSVELEDAKKDAESFANQVHDWLRWLNDVDNSLSSNKAVGGLPETAQEQLDKFLVLYNEMDQYRPKISEVLENGENFILKSPENASSALAHNIALLRQKWDAVATKANDRKTKLEIALVDAIEYDEMLKQFVDWLTKAEQYLNRQDPVSRLMEPLTEQMKEHRMFQEDVQAEKEIAMELEKKGTKLKYYCQKQDTILIKNLLVSAQHRWDKVVSRTADRTKQLDVGYNETKDFYDAWQTLCEWLDQKRKWLEDEQTTSVPTNAEKIREYLNKHKEFQRELGAMQPTYDSTSKSGKLVKDHAPKVEQGPLQDMINMMRDKWSALSNMAIERQRKLEEALLFSGHFNEAVDALLDWLTKVEPTLAEDRLVHGDLDTVTGLLDDHKTFRKELEAREANVETIRKAADQLMQAGDEESNAEVESHLNQVNAKWEVVKGLATVADGRLSDAKTMADHFHRRTHAMLEWLSDIETKLKFAGAVSEDENQLQKQLDSLKNLQDELEMQKPVLDDVLELGDKILEKAHPDAVDPMKHWQIILQARWDEVSSWAQDRQQRSKDQMTMLHDRDELLDNLLHWLHEKETQLMAADEIELPMLPEAAPEVERLLEEHLEFEQELSSRQPEIEEVTKGRKKAEKPPEHESTATKPKSTAAAPLTRHISVRLKNPKAQKVADKWGNVWLSSMQRKTRLTDLLNRLRELHRLRDFDFDDWRKRYMAWMQHKKSRVMDFFRRQDKDNDGRVTRKEFIEGILASRFPTTQLEMEKVADIFDKDRDGYIDYKEFVAALKPNPEAKVVEKGQERVHIQKEVQRQIQMCTCHHKYKIQEVGEGKYKFGEQLRLVRILRSTVMVRVGGGWVALDEFLVKNDPCRAKGRTNIELREKFILPDGASQTMTYFNRKGSNRSPGSHASSSSGSSFATPGAAGHSHIHSHTHKVTPGPIMKIREKTERSMPMSKTAKIRSPLTNGAASANSSGGTPDSEVFSIMSNERRSSGDLLSPNEARSSSRRGSGVVNGAATSGSGSRPPSRAGSDIPVFKPPSRPPSRAGSDVSDASINSRDSSTTPSRIPSAQRKPKSAQSTTKKI